MARWRYLIPVLVKRMSLQDTNCPHCGDRSTILIGRKHIVLELRKCASCGLLFRWPKDRPEDNNRFYAGLYSEESGLTTQMPSSDQLEQLLDRGFANSDRDFSTQIATLKKYSTHGRVLDYGASWGYGTWQLMQAGYDALGYEIDPRRAEYGRTHLGVRLLVSSADFDAIPDGTFDLIFTNHVLEHLPDLATTFQCFSRLLKDGGVLYIAVPNCTGMEQPEVFKRKRAFAFGEKHTMAYSAEFFFCNLPAYGFQIESISTSANPNGETESAVDGYELTVVARKPELPSGAASAVLNN
jgi:SAM-dependent methyltransferase